MSALVDRFLSLGRWRWTPFVGLTAGSMTVVLALTLLVPERIGSVLAPPPRSSAQLAVGAPGLSTEQEPNPDELGDERANPSPPARSATTPRIARGERRRGFSPVIRPDEPPAPEIVPPPPDDPEAHERWRQGQAAASRAASEAGTRAARGAAIPGNRMHLPPNVNSEPPAMEPAFVPVEGENQTSENAEPPPAPEE